jgi:hypothetical protein
VQCCAVRRGGDERNSEMGKEQSWAGRSGA